MKTFPKIVAVLLLLLPWAVAQETRPDEQTRVYQENGRWSRQITGSLPAAKNLRVKVDSGSVRVQGGSQQTINYSISNHSYATSEEKARREFEAYKISFYVRGDTAWVLGEWQISETGRRRRRYRLTSAGQKKVGPLRAEWSELFRALRQLAKVADA